jgi:hypothetical protein
MFGFESRFVVALYGLKERNGLIIVFYAQGPKLK